VKVSHVPALFAFPLAAAACAPESALGEVHRHRQAWSATEPAAYEFTYRYSCFCDLAFTPWRVTVDHGRVVRAVPLRWADSADRYAPPAHPTLDTVFAWADQAFVLRADYHAVTYEPHWHFPTMIRIDWSVRMADDEARITVSEFRPLTASSRVTKPPQN
jgi:hypothetical protein